MKAANVFIHKDDFSGVQNVKIGDLGVAKLLNSNTCFATTVSNCRYQRPLLLYLANSHVLI